MSLDIQIQSITRYFKTKDSCQLNAEFTKRILKLTKAKSKAKLTQEQLTTLSHHLHAIEQVLYRYYWCICLIEEQLLQDMLARELDNDTTTFNREFNGSNTIDRVIKLARQLIDLDILKNLY